MKKIRKWIGLIFFILSVFPNSWASQKSITVNSIETQTGGIIDPYKSSHALIVGISNYTNGWPDLESIPGELNLLEASLKNKGFNIVRINNPTATELKAAFANFIERYGYDPENRLMFFYSGHGHTMDNGRKGYLVPTDAPHPEEALRKFKQKALDMGQITAWARQMDAKHALFLFDSCFSGTIFKQKNLLPRHPPQISQWTMQPVRQFISAGSAGETVPANSTFTPAIIDAINGKADLNNDGYVIGTEIGLFLQTEVPRHVNQTPQYGKINDYILSRGDFVFFIDKLVITTKPEGEKTPAVTTSVPVPPNKTQMQAELNLNLPDMGTANTMTEKSMPPNKKRPWYKNPWVWIGVFAAGGSAVYFNQSQDSSSGRSTVAE